MRRLDQTYRRLDDHRFDYTSEGDFRAVLAYDDAGLVVEDPGIAVRFALSRRPRPVRARPWGRA